MYCCKRFGWAARRMGAIVLLATVLGSANMVLAQQPPPRPPVPPPAIPPVTQLFLSDIYLGTTLDGFIQNLRIGFFVLDADIDGKLTQSDLDFHTRIDASHKLASSVSFVMSLDLDGDGGVTADEIRRAFRYNNRMELGQAAFDAARQLPTLGADAREKIIEDDIRWIMALDADKDGRVVPAEASKYSQPGWLPPGRGVLAERTRLALLLATGSTREITMADYQAAAVALFNKIDSDSNGIISQQESSDYLQRPDTPTGAARIAAAEMVQKRQREEDEAVRKKQREAEAARAGCAMPAPSPKTKIILLGSYEAEALSSVAIGSQEVVIHAGRIHVEPGDEPLYVVVSTLAAMVWQFSGAVDRVERLAMSSVMTGPSSGDEKRPPLVGATGLSRDKISFFARSNCIDYFLEIPSSESIRAVAAVRAATGQEPFKVFTANSVIAFSIPSGKVETLADPHPKMVIYKEDAGTLRIDADPADFIVRSLPRRPRDDLKVYSPGGLVQIDPTSVVANLPVQTYEVFPQQAGLVQLLESGALNQNRGGEYVVQKKTRFPAGLHGAHSVKFVVPRGVPVPDGDPGHSCVTVEDQNSARKFEPCR